MKTIPLTKGKVAIIDDDDYEAVAVYKWYALEVHGIWYARRDTYNNGHHGVIRLHRFIMGVEDRQIFVDHKNRDGLDNRRQNLRLATRSENARNARRVGSSGFKGVYRSSKNRWEAGIRLNGKLKTVYGFVKPEDAARCYDALALEHYGQFARTNF